MARNNIFPRRIIFASLFAIGVAGGAQAQRVTTFDATDYVRPSIGNAMRGQPNAVGGGVATITGGGDNLQITYSLAGAGAGGGSPIQVGRFARLRTTGDGLEVEYLDVAPAGAGANREAWMTGGGDNTQVVYSSPNQGR